MGKTEQRFLCFQVALGRDCEQEEISRIPKHSSRGSSRKGFLDWQEEMILRNGSDLRVANFAK